MDSLADVHALTAGLVLLNSAGKIEPDYQAPKASSPAPPKAPPPRFVVEVHTCAAFTDMTQYPALCFVLRQRW